MRTRRRSLSLTGDQVAADIKSTKTGKAVSQPTYSDWENGVEQPGEQWFDALASFLGISRRDFLLLRYEADEPGAPAPLVERIDRLEERSDKIVELDEKLELHRRELEEQIRALRLALEDPESRGT